MTIRTTASPSFIRTIAGLTLTALVAAVPHAAIAQDCTPDPAITTITPGTLTAAGVVFPPVFDYADGVPSGIEGEVIRIIADELCLKLQVNMVSGEGVIPAVQAGRADVAVGGWSRTAARSELVGLSHPLYLNPVGLISKTGETDLTKLEGIVATPTGNSWIPEVQALIGDRLRLYQSFPDMYADLEVGRITQAIVLYNQAGVRFKERPVEGLKLARMDADPRISVADPRAQVGFPYIKDAEALGNAMNAVIDRLVADGTMADILDRNGFPRDSAEVGEPYLTGQK